MALTAYYTPLRQLHTLLPRSYISFKNRVLRSLQVDAAANHNVKLAPTSNHKFITGMLFMPLI